jgi:hypothetical protein
VALPTRSTRSRLKPIFGLNDFASPVYRGLIAAYQLNELGGSILTDGARQQRLTLSSTYNWARGPQGSVINFNGGQALGATTLKLDPFSFAFWMNISTTTPAHQVIAGKSDGAQAFGTLAPGVGWVIEINGSGATSDGVQLNTASGGGVARLYRGALPATGSWHFYVMVWDQSGTMSAGHAALYVDGVNQGMSGVSSAGAYTSDSGKNLLLGIYQGGTNPGSNLQIGSFFAWNRIITASEAQDLFIATYPSIPRVYRYAPGVATKSLAATAATKSATLGRKILITLAAAKHTFQGALTAARVFTLTATAHTKQGSLTTFIPPTRIIAAQMLLRTGTLGRAITHQLAATKAHFAGALSTVKANLKTLTATAHTKAGALSTNSGVHISAVHALFAGHLSLIVNHATPPGTCTPVATCTMPPAISHVETCEETGS